MGSHLSYHCASHASYTAAAKVTATASGTTTALAAAALVASLKQRVCDWPQLTLSRPYTPPRTHNPSGAKLQTRGGEEADQQEGRAGALTPRPWPCSLPRLMHLAHLDPP